MAHIPNKYPNIQINKQYIKFLTASINKQADLKMTHEDFGPEEYIPSSNTVTGVATGTLPTKLLRDSNIVDLVRTRETLTTGDFNSLKQDIKENGIQTPLTIAIEKNNTITIIDGTHRLLAAEELGIKEVPVDVRFFGGINKTHPEVLKDVEINNMNKQASSILISGKWAIYNYDVYVVENDVTHDEWFKEIGLPTRGIAFDKVTRGKYKIYNDRVLQIIYYEYSGTKEEFEGRQNTLIEKIGHQDLYDRIEIKTSGWAGKEILGKQASQTLYNLSYEEQIKIATKYKVTFYDCNSNNDFDSMITYDTEQEAEEAGKEWMREGREIEDSNYDYVIYPVEDLQASSQPIEIIEDLDTTCNSLKSLDKISYKMADILKEDLNIGLIKKKEDIIAFMKNREQWEAGLHTSRTMLGETFMKTTNAKQADTTLFNNKWITVRQDNKGYVYANVPEGVAILPYKTENDKTLYMLRSEQNSVLAPEGSLITVITGRRDDEDKEEQWYIQCAIRELEEEAGIIATEDKITLLGEMSTNKHTKQSDMLLAINVTGLEENEPETDGTDDEAQSYNFWVDEKGLRDFIRTSKDSYLSTITNKFFNKDVNLTIVSMGRS